MKSRLSSRGTFFNSDCAVSVVLSAVMILGLVVLMIGIINVRYIPAWKSDAQHLHMDKVLDDISYLKSGIDMISAGTVDQDYPISMSVPVTMGGGDIPVIASGKSSGTLTMDRNCGMIIIANDPLGTVYDSRTDLLNLGRVGYYSHNDHYIDQLFEYENGALIIVQDVGSFMKLSPAFALKRLDGKNISIEISAIELAGEDRMISSSGIEEIKITSNASHVLFSGDILSEVTIEIYTAYPDAWVQYLNSTAKHADLEYGTDYMISSGGKKVIFALIEGGGENFEIQLYVRKITVDVAIGLI